ncbi:hypothetical protein ACERZ8_03775 [Tateyamaria armeniaca]|uniref:Uncharacterized protein n=1 Tax=Tateyamaria armeniaca TaxID=2518930 RepID=A0ABW8UST3_9RHOB
MNPANFYTRGVKEFMDDYWAAWLPSKVYSLGDVGRLNNSQFERIGSLDDYSIPYKIKRSSARGPLEISSGLSFSVDFTSDAKHRVQEGFEHSGDISLHIGFQTEGSFLVEINDSSSLSLVEAPSLEASIIDKYVSGEWKRDFFVVTDIVKADLATIIVAKEKGASLEFKISGSHSNDCRALIDASAQISLKRQKGDLFKMLSAKGTTPFFQLSHLKLRPFSTPKFKRRNMLPTDIEMPDPATIISQPGVRSRIRLELASP